MEQTGFCHQRNQPICPGQNFQIAAKNSKNLWQAGPEDCWFFSIPPFFPYRNLDWHPLTMYLSPHLLLYITVIQWLQLECGKLICNISESKLIMSTLYPAFLDTYLRFYFLLIIWSRVPFLTLIFLQRTDKNQVWWHIGPEI